MTAFRLAHISDPHLPPPPLSARWSNVASKRLLSRFAWRRKHARHDKGVLDAIAADLLAASPDHVAITGDLINFATPEEFAAARAWLQTFGDPQRVTVSPGNHDALVARDAPDGFAPWRPWLGDSGAGFPYLRIRGPVALINLSSAVETPLHLAQGRLGKDQIDQAEAILRECEERGLYRVLMVHHPVASGAMAKRKSLTDAAALREVLHAAGAELILHGHAHAAMLTAVPGPAGPIPELGAPSASTPVGHHDEAARWNEISIARDGGGFRTSIAARGVGTDGTIRDLGRYTLA